MHRNRNYNEELSRRLQHPPYARTFLTALMEGKEGLSLEEALRQTIEIIGIKEFSEQSNIPSSNLVAFVKGRRRLKPETLNQLLQPFHLRTKLILEQAS